MSKYKQMIAIRFTQKEVCEPDVSAILFNYNFQPDVIFFVSIYNIDKA